MILAGTEKVMSIESFWDILLRGVSEQVRVECV